MTLITKRFFTVIIAAITLLIVGLLIEELLSIRSGSLFGHTQTGHVVGWIGLAVIVTVFGYSANKRFGRKAGWPKVWFMVHQVAGIFGPLLILIHAGSHFHAGSIVRYLMEESDGAPKPGSMMHCLTCHARKSKGRKVNVSEGR